MRHNYSSQKPQTQPTASTPSELELLRRKEASHSQKAERFNFFFVFVWSWFIIRPTEVKVTVQELVNSVFTQKQEWMQGKVFCDGLGTLETEWTKPHCCTHHRKPITSCLFPRENHPEAGFFLVIAWKWVCPAAVKSQIIQMSLDYGVWCTSEAKATFVELQIAKRVLFFA